MIKICRYDESFSREAKELFGTLFEETVKHADVLKETVSVAAENGHLVGICFLTVTSSYKYADREHPGYLNMDFEAVHGENEVEISAMLIDALINDYRKICRSEKNKRIILRTFCSASSADYMNYLVSFGFRAEHYMHRMRKDLSETMEIPGNGDFDFTVRAKNGKELKVCVEAVRAEGDTDIKGLDGYFEANGRAFGIPDSENELEYRLREQNGVQFVARIDGRVAAAVSVWENNPGSVSTENIFCIEEYRRLGVTENLIRGVCGYLAARGYREATLFVYGVNTYAVELYTKLGYMIYGGTLHMHYEDDYVPALV